MESRKKYAIGTKCGSGQFCESQFLGSFSHSKPGKGDEPTPKKPKLEVSKNGYFPKVKNDVSKPVDNKKDGLDDVLWGNDFNFDQAELEQVEYIESVALSQMVVPSQNMSTTVQTSQENAAEKSINGESSSKKTVPLGLKNSPRVPLRRVSSSQWPSSSTFSPSSSTNNTINKKGSDNIDFLQKELERFRLENMKITEELKKKGGEARVLRDRMNSSEKEKEKMKKEFVTKIYVLKAEAQQNMSGLLKENKSLKGQLDVQNMEIKTAERRRQMSSAMNRIQPDSPNRRIGTPLKSFQTENSLECELERNMMKAKTRGLPLKFIREYVTPELMAPSQPEAALSEAVHTSNPRLFSGLLGADGGGTSMARNQSVSMRTELRSPHSCITSCATLLLNPSLVDITSGDTRQTISQVVDVCRHILAELLKKLDTATCPNNRLIERERELLLLGSRQLPLDRDYNLISHRELCKDERGIPARRALGLMSLLVNASDLAATDILSSSKASSEILDTVKNIVRQIEKQRRTLVYHGVLAGSVALIKSLLRVKVAIPKESQTQVVDVLRWVVSARPGAVVVRDILQCLLAAARHPYIVNSLCHNSAEKTYKENSRHSIIQFTPESCVLQVLCSLLKASETPRKHLLTDLLARWVLSLFSDGQPRPHWLTAAPSANSCQCHSLVCKVCFFLLSEACFTYSSATEDERRDVEQVLARGVLLVNTFMEEDQHLLAIVDPYSLGCYEHFLHFMGDSKIRLDPNTHEILGFLCAQEEVLKQTSNSTNNSPDTSLTAERLRASLPAFQVGEDRKTDSEILDGLLSL